MPRKPYNVDFDLDHTGIANFTAEIYTTNVLGGTGTLITTLTASNGKLSHTFTPAAGQGFIRVYFKKNSTENTSFYIDNLSIQTVASPYKAVVVMTSDYYPFGYQMQGRHTNDPNYRYGYNGMEKDAEMHGDGNSYTTEFRQYDPRLGRWLSLDPLMAEFPWMSPYNGFDNNPIYYTDPLGLETGGKIDEITVTAKRTFGMKVRTLMRELNAIKRNKDLTFSQKNAARNKSFTKFFHAIGKHKLAKANAVAGGAGIAIQQNIDVELIAKGIIGMFDYNKVQKENAKKAAEAVYIAKRYGYSPIRSAIMLHAIEEGRNWRESDLQDKSTIISGKIIEVATIVYGAGLASRVSRVAGEVKTVATEAKASSGPLKNMSGSIEESANLARNQPYGANTNIFRRLPKSAQDIQALTEAQAGMGRKLPLTMGDPRYIGWEKWHHSVGPKGSKSVVHYIRNPETGFLTDFKFK